MSPTLAVAYEGTKQRFVISQPCSEEPRPFSIFIYSANAVSNPIAVNARDIERINKPIPKFCIINFLILNIKLMLICKTGAKNQSSEPKIIPGGILPSS